MTSSEGPDYPEYWFEGKLLVRQTFKSAPFVGVDQAEECARELASNPGLAWFPRVQQSLLGHELDHVRKDPDPQGHFEASLGVLTIGIFGQEYSRTRAVVSYHRSGKKLLLRETQAILLAPEHPSISDKIKFVLAAILKSKDE